MTAYPVWVRPLGERRGDHVRAVISTDPSLLDRSDPAAACLLAGDHPREIHAPAAAPGPCRRELIRMGLKSC
jgi:hypothetical protein